LHQQSILQEAFMKRKVSKVNNTVLEKMNYSNGSIVSKWKEAFPKRQPPKPKRAVRNTPAIKPKAKSDEPAITLIQKIPVVFQLERRENPADFERMAFVIRACSKDGSRPFLCVLHVEQTKTGSRCVATDGKRLHVAEIGRKINNGNYKPLMTKDAIGLSALTDDVTFPNWPRVVPEDTIKRGIIDLEQSGFGKDPKQTEKLAIAVNAFMRQTGETINLRYLEDLPKKRGIVHSQKEKGKAVILKESGAEKTNFAVLMPLPPEDVETAAKAMAA
jgi:hypothetical protein